MNNLIKTNDEIELLREAGKYTALTIKKVAEYIKPGISTRELDEIAYKQIIEFGCTPSFKGLDEFEHSICTSVNDCLCHGVPSEYILKEGDIITIDCGCCYKGYHGDSARTFIVGETSEENIKLVNDTKIALELAIKEVRPGNKIGDISNAIESYLDLMRYSTPIDYAGHGVGKELHEEPRIPNIGRKGEGETLFPGMVLAIEPIAIKGRPHCVIINDGCSVCTKDHSFTAHFEDTVLVTDSGCDILTKED